MSQLALPLVLEDYAVFDSFLPAGNESVVGFLNDIVDARSGPGGWLWGPPAVGKTHLLQAICERTGDRAQFVPLASVHEAGPAIIEGLQSRQFVCIDDVDHVAGNDDWELGLFTLFNALTDADGILVCTASSAPRECGFRLPDLQSRLSRLPSFHVRPLDDDARIEALQLRARHRGLDMPRETANYLLSRNRRDMASLYGILDTLDAEALKAQRRLTVPFVKSVLAASLPKRA